MKKVLTLLGVFFMCALTVRGQTTQVTGQVKDANGVPYAGAQMSAQLVFAGTPVSNPTVTISVLATCRANGFGSAPCQVPFTPTNGPFNLDGGGNIPGGGITLQDNTLVTPSGTQWAFKASSAGNPPPLGTGPQTCAATLTISGGAQSVSASLAGCPALANAGAGGPISTQPTGTTCGSSMTFTPASTFLTDFFFNLNCNVTSSTVPAVTPGNEVTISFTNISPGFSFTWPANFSGIPLAPPVGGTVSATFQYCGTVTNGNCLANTWQNVDQGPVLGVIPPSPKNIIDVTAPPYNVNFDATWATGLNVTFNTAQNCNGTTVPAGTCIATLAPIPAFVAAQAGKYIQGNGNCPSTNPPACANRVVVSSTIVTVIDAHHVQISNAVTISSNANGANFFWGTVGQSAGLANAVATLGDATATGNALIFPCPTSPWSGGMILDNGAALTVPGHSAAVGLYGCPGGGSIFIPTYDLAAGAGTTGILMSIASGFGQTITQYGGNDAVENLFFWGAGAPTNTFGTSVHILLSFGGANLRNVSIIGYLWNVTTTFVINGISWGGIDNTCINCVSFAGGNFPCSIVGGSQNGLTWVGGLCGGAPGNGMTATGGGVSIQGCYCYGGQGQSGDNGFGLFATPSNGGIAISSSYIAGIIIAAGSTGTTTIRGNQISNTFTPGTFPSLQVRGGSVIVEGNFWQTNANGWLSVTGGTVYELPGNTNIPASGAIVVTSPGVFVPLGGGSMATQTISASTNFGTPLTAQTLVASTFARLVIQIRIGTRQVTAGTTCGAGSNTVLATISWTAPGSTAETQVTTTLTISANGAVDSGATAYQTFQIPVKVGTAITYTTTSALASAGCTVVPQYVVEAGVS